MPRTAYRIWMLALFGALIILGSCGTQRGHAKKNQQDVHDRYFLDRVSMKVRHGKLMSDEEVSRYEKTDLATIVRSLMKDKDFVETVFDFNLYFLGFKNSNIDFPDGKPSIRSNFGMFNNAITSAQEVAKEGDFLKIFDFKQPIYANPLLVGKIDFGGFVDDIDGNRANGLTQFRDFLTRARTLLASDDATVEAICDFGTGLRNFEEIHRLLRTQVSGYGFGSLKFDSFIQNMCLGIGGDSESGEGSEDSGDEAEDEAKTSTPLTAVQRRQLKTEVDALEKYVNYLMGFLPEKYQVNSVQDFVVLDTSPVELFAETALAQTSSWFWRHLPNSSTNYNRKRASYVLKRFMCDDLTPIAIELPKEHTQGGKHASDPGCMACHYKLDPVGAFFREYGLGGTHYTPSENNPDILFDDFASIDFATYVAAWESPDRRRATTAGIIRSTKDEAQNVYPAENKSGPEGLFEILRTLPESRQCIVKNAIKYLVDEKLTVDAGYVRSLTDNFNQRAEENSSTALKELFVEVLTSESFRRDSIEGGVCYDYAPGVNPAQRPPCEIADIIERNCASCHSGASARGGLDLREWVKLGDGYGFTHVENGKNLSRVESFKRLVDAITATDEAKRMPLNVFMAPSDREALYKFFNTVK